MRFKQSIYESIQAPLARPLFPYAGNAQEQPSSHQPPVTSHQPQKKEPLSRFLFLISSVRREVSFSFRGRRGSLRPHRSIHRRRWWHDRCDGRPGRRGWRSPPPQHRPRDSWVSPFMSLLIFHNNESDEVCHLAKDPMGGRLRQAPSLMRRMASLSAQSYACVQVPSAAGFSFGAGRQMK